MSRPSNSGSITTIGHSNRTLEEFIELLRLRHIELLVDLRTVPRSRHNPQFNRETLPGSLAAAGIDYTHMAGLGGLRHPHADSVNSGWRNASFRGYADYMQTPEFEKSLAELVALAKRRRLAIMCAEAVPWRCHRSLVADALVARGVPVEHVVSSRSVTAHKLTPFARVEGTSVSYPPDGSLF